MSREDFLKEVKEVSTIHRKHCDITFFFKDNTPPSWADDDKKAETIVALVQTSDADYDSLPADYSFLIWHEGAMFETVSFDSEIYGREKNQCIRYYLNSEETVVYENGIDIVLGANLCRNNIAQHWFAWKTRIIGCI